MDIEERAELLAAANEELLVTLADNLIEIHGDPSVIAPPETVLVAFDVREPVEDIRFRVGDVIVSRAEVEIAGVPGWGVRPGDDHLGAIAAAICAAVGDAGLNGSEDVDTLCQQIAAERSAADLAEWAQIAATRVQFEELDW